MISFRPFTADTAYLLGYFCADGNITMVGETSPGKFEVVATIPTQRSARTIGSDQKSHKLYLPAAESGPPVEKDGKKKAAMLPDSFQIVVVGR